MTYFKELLAENEDDVYEFSKMNLFDVKNASIKELIPNKINANKAIVGKEYLSVNGSTVECVAPGIFDSVSRTPLYSVGRLSDLTDVQLRLFWVLKVNCKNGTYHGV